MSSEYGTAIYGTDCYYKCQDTDLNWFLTIDWLGDGKFTGLPDTFNNEMFKAVGLHVKRGRDHLIRADGGGFEHYRPGEASITLDNSDGRYDPYNVSSPLYGYLKPGRYARLWVNQAGTDYGIIYGIVDNIRPIRRGSRDCVILTIKDGLYWMQNKRVWAGLKDTVLAYVLIYYILEYSAQGIGWPSSEWPTIYPGTDADNLNQKYWWGWDRDAVELLHEVEDEQLGVFFHSRDGQGRWHNRDYTFRRSMSVDASYLLRDITISYPYDTIRNQVKIKNYPKLYNAVNDTLWYLEETDIIPTIANGDTFYIEAHFQYGNYNPVCGASITFNHTVNTQEDGLGVDITADCPLTYNSQIGTGAQIWITNNSGSDGYIIELNCVGDAIYAPHVNNIEGNDADSQDEWGIRPLLIDSPWTENFDRYQIIASWLADKLADPNLYPMVQFRSQLNGTQFYLDLHDRLLLTIDKFSLDDESFRVGSIEHEWLNENGTDVLTRMQLEPYFVYDLLFWTFTTELGVKSYFA